MSQDPLLDAARPCLEEPWMDPGSPIINHGRHPGKPENDLFTLTGVNLTQLKLTSWAGS